MRLDVWLEPHPTPIGMLIRYDDNSLSFQYAPDAAQPLSLSLPLGATPYTDAATRAWFGNLLFEGRALDRIIAQHGLDRDDIGGLLFHLGADCPGAVSVTPEGTGPGKRPGIFPDDYVELAPDALLHTLRSLHFKGRLPDETGDPSPLAGVQPKLALLVRDNSYYIPRENSRAPTTHILKVSPSDTPDITRHEAALLTLARKAGLEVADHAYLEFDDAQTGALIGAILSTRFDRAVAGNQITRLHSEDLCQALGLPRQLKYERDAIRADRCFSMPAVGNLADQTAVPGLFRMGFLHQTLFNLAVGNSDNHAKNASILYKGTSGTLAPLYDVVPVMMDTVVTHQLAFSLGGAEWAEDVTLNSLKTAMRDLGFAKPALSHATRQILQTLMTNGPEALASAGGKSLADAVVAQLTLIQAGLDLPYAIAPRDYYPRLIRDEKPAAGGWGGIS